MKQHALMILVVATFATGCDETPTNPGGGKDGATVAEAGADYTSIIISPQSPSLKVTFKGGQKLQFYAQGKRSDGTKVPLSDKVTWGLDNSVVGSIDSHGELTASGAGGATKVNAILGNLSASVTLTVTLADSITESGISAADLKQLQQTSTTDAVKAPSMIYPENDTMIPANLPPMELQWKRGDSQNKVFSIRFSGAYLDVTVATKQLSWKADKAAWNAFIYGSKGAAIKVTLRGAGATGPLYASASTSINVSTITAPGTIYYWATGPKTSLKNGIIKIEAGSDKATDYYTQANNGSKRCSGCHAITRDGSKMVFTEYPLQSWENWAKGVDVKTKKTFLPEDKLLGNFFAFSKTGDRLLYAEAGGMTIRRMSDNTVLTSFKSLAGMFASHPDWSPIDDKLTFALYPKKYDYAENFCQGSVVVADVPGAGEPWKHTVIVQSVSSDDNNFYPAFSPDSKYIVFNKAGRYNNTKLGEYDCDGFANPAATLHIVPATGGTPVALKRANSTGKVTNTWAKWAPSSSSVGVWWLAFSSTRDYGAVLINSTKQDIQGEKHPQIWITAIRLDLLAKGKDPSHPAFWLPGQRTDSGNHIPFWTKTLK